MIFSKDFLKREIRDGFEIDEMMKRAWTAQMEVLLVVDEVCQRHGLQYFAYAGTLLGAVRHQGFIPWDDDIDICMKRNDYDALIRILPQGLPYGFVVAGMYAANERLQMAAYVPQLRVIADETLWNFNDYMKRFHGFPYQRVGIDIFPLDAVPQDIERAKQQKDIIRYGIPLLRDWEILEKEQRLESALQKLEQLSGMQIPRGKGSRNWIWRMLDAVSSLYRIDEAEELTKYDVWIDRDAFRLKKEWFDEVVYLPFENIKVPVPVGYDEFLTLIYGDYMRPVRGTAGHDYPFYGHMENELKKQIAAVGFTGSVEEFCDKVSTGKLYV
ncbi:MAG: LicD family protein [Clostridiales bacterium]|nr:LicD family protein [Roseburia sp.]MDD7637178.1 LicD family protein [Clostridiales bacterium]